MGIGRVSWSGRLRPWRGTFISRSGPCRKQAGEMALWRCRKRGKRVSGQKPRPALFLDRDGVINVDHGYVHRIDEFEFLPGIFDLVRFAVHEVDWPVIVVTNQAGIGRGLFDEQAFECLTIWMRERFVREGAPLTKVYHC